jgi:5'-hydroxyaverantin dehydrogenase
LDSAPFRLFRYSCLLDPCSVQFVKTDVTSWSSIIAAFKATIASSPRETIDIVVPNAGVAGGGMYYWLSNTEADAETGEPKQPPQHVVGVNFVGVYNTVHAAAWYFKNHPGPVEEGTTPKSKLIVLVASMGGYQAMPTVCDYNASKWGVRGLFYSLRNLDGLLGPGKPQFRVNLIAPTWVKTNMTKGMSSRMDENSTVKMAEVSDCVDVVLRMAADENIKGTFPAFPCSLGLSSVEERGAMKARADRLQDGLLQSPQTRSPSTCLTIPMALGATRR